MDRRERAGSQHEVFLQSQLAFQARLWTAMPGIVQSYNPAACTVVVQVAIKAQIRDQAGTWNWVDIPQLVDVPVVFPSGGGYTLSFPLKAGDEVLAVFASRCIDAWWQSGSVQQAMEPRMHDLSDAFALPGPRSQPRVVPALATDRVALRNDVGDVFVALRDDKSVQVSTPANIVATAHNVTATASGDVTLTVSGALSANVTGSASISAASVSITATTVSISGALTVGAGLAVTGSMTNNGTNVGSTHVHQFFDDDGHGNQNPDTTDPPH